MEAYLKNLVNNTSAKSSFIFILKISCKNIEQCLTSIQLSEVNFAKNETVKYGNF